MLGRQNSVKINLDIKLCTGFFFFMQVKSTDILNPQTKIKQEFSSFDDEK